MSNVKLKWLLPLIALGLLLGFLLSSILKDPAPQPILSQTSIQITPPAPLTSVPQAAPPSAEELPVLPTAEPAPAQDQPNSFSLPRALVSSLLSPIRVGCLQLANSIGPAIMAAAGAILRPKELMPAVCLVFILQTHAMVIFSVMMLREKTLLTLFTKHMIQVPIGPDGT